MKMIELENRTAQEVFEELKYRLESIGYLPDEYLLMAVHWENDRKIPESADIFCTTDYGGSEGVYLDAYLKWYDEKQKKPITEKFFTGKTLGESGSDLDKMFLTSSAITKAFYGGDAVHTRYMRLGDIENTGGSVIHLSVEEQQTIMEALVEQRERQENAMSQTEQLLRRMTGSITAFVNAVGQRPLRLDDYDRTIFAIHDGDLKAFKEYYLRAIDRADDLLIEAAGRPGEVGRKMTLLVLADGGEFAEEAYRAACQKAVGLADSEKVLFLLKEAEDHVEELSPAFYGELVGYAYTSHRTVAARIIQQCTDEQIAAAPPYLLEMAAVSADWQTLTALIEKGISSEGSAARTLHMLTCQKQDRWIAEDLLGQRMWVGTEDYGALRACIKNDAEEVCKLLLDGGMDFDKYLQWSQKLGHTGHEATIQALADHWAEMKAEMEQSGQANGGMTLG